MTQLIFHMMAAVGLMLELAYGPRSRFFPGSMTLDTWFFGKRIPPILKRQRTKYLDECSGGRVSPLKFQMHFSVI